MWLVAVVDRCVVGCEHCEGYCSHHVFLFSICENMVLQNPPIIYTHPVHCLQYYRGRTGTEEKDVTFTYMGTTPCSIVTMFGTYSK